MKLTAGNILFIDNYLKESEVVYADIRMEMIDHIASAVEIKMEDEDIDFHDAFKVFMLYKKKEILKGNRRAGNFNFSVLKRFGKFLVQPKMLLLAVAFFIFGYRYLTLNEIDADFWLDGLKPLPGSVLFAAMVAQLIYTGMVMKKRFYYLERASLIPVIVFYAQLLIGRDFTALNIFATFFLIYIIAAYIIYFCQEIYIFKKSMKSFYA